MKALASTAFLFFIAGVCVAGPQPCQRRSNNVIDILTYNNVSNQKTGRCTGPKVYAPSQENSPVTGTATPSTTAPTNTTTTQTFTPSPLVNSYKEFR